MIFKNIFSKTKAKKKAEYISIEGRYDAASPDFVNERHWLAADNVSPNDAVSESVREQIKKKARYEISNNSYARGIVSTLVNDTVGSVLMVNVSTGDPEKDDIIESDFKKWAEEVGFVKKIRELKFAKIQDGEGVAIFTTDENLTNGVTLNIVNIESDYITSDIYGTDGVVSDESGNVKTLYITKNHPKSGSMTDEATPYNADDFIYIWNKDRIGQMRGVPQITPALPLFAQLRRYTLAVLAAAETAASFAGILFTNSPPDGEAANVKPLDAIEIERNMLITAPAGWDLRQIAAEQPTNTYSDFKREIINEIGRCLNMPYNVASGNSSDYNYASGRLDYQVYFRDIEVERMELERQACNKTFRKWLEEYLATAKVILTEEEKANMTFSWFWESREHSDPDKDSKAIDRNLKNRTMTYKKAYSKKGEDWRKEITESLDEEKFIQDYAEKIGLKLTGDKDEEAFEEENPGQ